MYSVLRIASSTWRLAVLIRSCTIQSTTNPSKIIRKRKKVAGIHMQITCQINIIQFLTEIAKIVFCLLHVLLCLIHLGMFQHRSKNPPPNISTSPQFFALFRFSLAVRRLFKALFPAVEDKTLPSAF